MCRINCSGACPECSYADENTEPRRGEHFYMCHKAWMAGAEKCICPQSAESKEAERKEEVVTKITGKYRFMEGLVPVIDTLLRLQRATDDLSGEGKVLIDKLVVDSRNLYEQVRVELLDLV